ncbi:Hypothetical predicted protein, partial [Pelobates cultripes]
MSQHRTKKAAETKDKVAFFAARTPQHKHTDTHTQDGVESDPDADHMGAQDYRTDTLLTTHLLQKMLDAAVSKMQVTITSALADIKTDITVIE